jgi:hypothetical protein
MRHLGDPLALVLLAAACAGDGDRASATGGSGITGASAAGTDSLTTTAGDGSSAGSGPGTTHGGTSSASGGSGPKLDVGAGGSTGAGDDGGGTCDQDVDIVFVMDVSTSMDVFLNKLASEILVVDAALTAMNLPAAPHYGLVVFVDDFDVSNGGQPYPTVMQLQTDFQDWASFASTNSQISVNWSNFTWPENSLDALYAAADQFQWRPSDTTLRLVIHTTDDTFWEGPDNQDMVNIVHDYDGTVAKLQSEQVRVFSFASMIGGQCECEDVSPGWFGPYQGKPSIPMATGGGVWDLDQVLAGNASLADAIEDAVVDSMCDPYPPPG